MSSSHSRRYNLVDGVAGAAFNQRYIWLLAMAAACAVTPLSWLIFCPPSYQPAGFSVPLYPITPCASIFVNTFLLGTLSQKAYLRFAWWTLAVTLLYLAYSVFAAQLKDERIA